MADFISAAAGLSTSVLGTANSVIYTAAVVLAGAGVGLADTGTLGVRDHEHAAGGGTAGGGFVGAGALAGAGITNGPSTGDTLPGFLHANLDPHLGAAGGSAVGLVGAVLHTLGVG